MSQIMDRDKRFIMDKIKLGRSGKSFYIWGVPEEMKGPYASHNDAQVVYDSILKNHKDWEVSGKGIVKKTA